MSSEKSSSDKEQAVDALNTDNTEENAVEQPNKEQQDVEHEQTEDAEGAIEHEQTEDAEGAIEQLREELAKAEAKAAESWDTLMRLQAEMDNQRKRSEKQVSDAHKYAVQKFVEQLLPVIDSLEMGLQAEGDLDSIREGMNLTLKQFESVMEKSNLEAVSPLGEKFNPELHQAMAMQPSDEYDDGVVSSVMQKGYTLNGRLVRPAMVMVAKNT